MFTGPDVFTTTTTNSSVGGNRSKGTSLCEWLILYSEEILIIAAVRSAVHQGVHVCPPAVISHSSLGNLLALCAWYGRTPTEQSQLKPRGARNHYTGRGIWGEVVSKEEDEPVSTDQNLFSEDVRINGRFFFFFTVVCCSVFPFISSWY